MISSHAKNPTKITDPLSSDFQNWKGRRGLFLWLFILWLFALVLNFVGLGELPLRDFDEGTVARVALEITDKRGIDQLLPTLWGNNYLNKPPGIHWLIAKVMQFSQHKVLSKDQLPSEFFIRLAPATLSTFLIPLGGLIQFYLRPKDRFSSITTASILLTLLPIIRHGRLAMLDGTQLSAMALFWLCLISLDGQAGDRWRFLVAGLASSFMLLIKAPLLIPVVFASFFPLFIINQDKKYLQLNSIFWYLIGIIPGFSWHYLNAIKRGSGAIWLWWGDGAGRVLFYPGSGSDLGWKVPIIEIIEGGWPWLVLLPIGLLWSFQERKTAWGIWSLSIFGVLSLSIFPLQTQLPWYSHSLWLPIALLCSPPLSWIVQRIHTNKLSARNLLSKVPIFWSYLGLLLLTLSTLSLIGAFNIFRQYIQIALFAGFGWFIGGFLLLHIDKRKRLLGLLSMVLGSFFAFISLMGNSFWLWELNEHWPVQPVAELISRVDDSQIALDEEFERPSLNWYAQKRVRTLKDFPEARWIVTKNSDNIQFLSDSRRCKIFAKETNWSLIFCSP